MRLRSLLVAAIASLLCAGAVLAQSGTPATEEANAVVRPELKEALPQSQLVGQGRLTVWGFQVYDARLWAPNGFTADSFGTSPLALELAYLRDFAARDVAERSLQEMRRSQAITEVQAARWRAELLRVIPDVSRGDRILGLHRPGVGAAFWFNGKISGEVRDAEFARLFFGIWLSPQTSEPKLRNALLAGARP
jgi:Chalcone isomerase-like